jgi:glutamate carboxypeptidase
MRILHRVDLSLPYRMMTLSDLEKRICDAIRKREPQMRADLAAHVAIPTGQNFTHGIEKYRAVVVERLKSLGAKIEVIAGRERPEWLRLPAHVGGEHATRQVDSGRNHDPVTVIATKSASSKSKKILIAGHLDTVHDPHGTFQKLMIAGDVKTATGPGVVDMKGGIVIALHALEALAELGVETHWTFLLNSDEETGSFHSIDAITQAAREHDVGIALEPALPDGSLVVSRMGAGQFKIEVFGQSAHVGRDFTRGISAVNALAEIVLKLAKMSDAQRGLIVNVGPLVGGQVTNAVPDYAACWGNVRFADAETAREIERKLVALATLGDSLPRVVVHHAINRPAKPLTPAVEKLAAMAREAASSLGQQLPFGSTGGVCDGNILQAAGLPTIDTLGVRGGNLHRTDEFIELASLVERAQLLAVLLARISSDHHQSS